MSKELNILQAIEMPVGTEFNILNAKKDNADRNYSKTAIVSKNGANAKILLGDGKYEFGFNDYVAGLKLQVIQKPVSFMEAVKAFSKRKVIECELNGEKFIYGDEYKNQLMDSNELAVGPNEILNGKWYIKED